MNLAENKTLEDLMSLALMGDQKSYAEVLKKVTIQIKPYLQKRLSQPQEVDDVLQEILISIHKAKHTYDSSRPFMPWVYAIAAFRLKDRLRKYYSDPLRNAKDIGDAGDIYDSDVTENTLSYEYIRVEVNKLPEKQAKILNYIHEQGFTAKETAAKMNMTESAVKVSAHRAYKILRTRLSK
jgi:RNA polymerase sigma-70 factor (ECF subfamily)